MERAVVDFARQHPGVVLYVNPRPCGVPRVVAEYCEWRVHPGSRGSGLLPGRASLTSSLPSPRDGQ